MTLSIFLRCGKLTISYIYNLKITIELLINNLKL